MYQQFVVETKLSANISVQQSYEVTSPTARELAALGDGINELQNLCGSLTYLSIKDLSGKIVALAALLPASFYLEQRGYLGYFDVFSDEDPQGLLGSLFNQAADLCKAYAADYLFVYQHAIRSPVQSFFSSIAEPLSPTNYYQVNTDMVLAEFAKVPELNCNISALDSAPLQQIIDFQQTQLGHFSFRINKLVLPESF